MNNKAKGTRWERDCQKMLEHEGYIVTRAGGSLGMFDLIARGRGGNRYIQCKCNSWGSPAERDAIKNLQRPPGTSDEIWRRDDRKPAPRIMRHSFYVSNLYQDDWHEDEVANGEWQAVWREVKRKNRLARKRHTDKPRATGG